MKKKAKSKLLVVDGENLLHRSYHKFINFRTSDGLPSGAIYGFLKSLHSLIFRFNPDHVIVVFDNGRSKHRTKILPGYKGDRTKLGMDYESLQSQKKTIRRVLSKLGVSCIYDKHKEYNYEADDYIALADREFFSHGLVKSITTETVIVSSDKDFCQRVNNHTKVFNPGKDVLVNVSNCKEVMGYSAEECVDYLSLLGDASDKIPGYPGIGEKKARQFLDKYGSIEGYLFDRQLGDEGFRGIDEEKLKVVYETNKELIDLGHFIKKHVLYKIPIDHGNFNEAKMKQYFNKYSLTSFKTKEFINLFKNLKRWNIEEEILPF